MMGSRSLWGLEFQGSRANRVKASGFIGFRPSSVLRLPQHSSTPVWAHV